MVHTVFATPKAMQCTAQSFSHSNAERIENANFGMALPRLLFVSSANRLLRRTNRSNVGASRDWKTSYPLKSTNASFFDVSAVSNEANTLFFKTSLIVGSCNCSRTDLKNAAFVPHGSFPRLVFSGDEEMLDRASFRTELFLIIVRRSCWFSNWEALPLPMIGYKSRLWFNFELSLASMGEAIPSILGNVPRVASNHR